MKTGNESFSVELDKTTIKEISERADKHTYPVQQDLFYEGQIPIVGYLLLSGAIQIMKNKKVKKILGPGALLGVRELMNNDPSKITAQILPNTKVCFLDKSTVKDFLNKHQTDSAGKVIFELINS